VTPQPPPVPPDTDDLLRNCRMALAANNAPMLAVCFTTLDKALRQGYPLPAQWAPAAEVTRADR
jgi:hypothetical protein